MSVNLDHGLVPDVIALATLLEKAAREIIDMQEAAEADTNRAYSTLALALAVKETLISPNATINRYERVYFGDELLMTYSMQTAAKSVMLLGKTPAGPLAKAKETYSDAIINVAEQLRRA